jgi:hypothetical protein
MNRFKEVGAVAATAIALMFGILAYQSACPAYAQQERSAASGISIADGEVCKEGLDCTCGNVTCNKGCKCQMTGPTGICVDCPIPDVPPVWFGLVGFALGAGVMWLVYRRRRPTKPAM